MRASERVRGALTDRVDRADRQTDAEQVVRQLDDRPPRDPGCACWPDSKILREFTASPAFANELGVLFQIVDDVLDVTGSSETLGKQQGSDGRLGKRTYVTEFGLDGARELAAQSHARAGVARAVAARATGAELEQITDFIATRSF